MDELKETFIWFNLFERGDEPDWKPGDSVYFRHLPLPFEFLVLILMRVLNFINNIFIHKKEAA
jgi:hypothetical protein